MFTELEGVAGFHPPLPPPPPPYHPPATPSHAQLKGAWRPRVPMPTPTRSFSYPCNRTLAQRHAAAKHGSSDYSSVPRPQPPDCTNPQAMGRALLSDRQAVSVFTSQDSMHYHFGYSHAALMVCTWDHLELDRHLKSHVGICFSDADEYGACYEGVHAGHCTGCLGHVPEGAAHGRDGEGVTSQPDGPLESPSAPWTLPLSPAQPWPWAWTWPLLQETRS